MFIRETAIFKTDVEKKLKVISIFCHFSPYIVQLFLKYKEITNCLNEPYTIISKREPNIILFCWFPQIEMESMDVGGKTNEIVKEAQEATPESDDNSDTGTLKTPNS